MVDQPVHWDDTQNSRLQELYAECRQGECRVEALRAAVCAPPREVF
jgi:hypothetical protein